MQITNQINQFFSVNVRQMFQGIWNIRQHNILLTFFEKDEMKNEMKDIVLRSVKAGYYRVYADISFYCSWNQDQFDADATFYTMKNMTLFFYYFVKFSVVFFFNNQLLCLFC